MPVSGKIICLAGASHYGIGNFISLAAPQLGPLRQIYFSRSRPEYYYKVRIELIVLPATPGKYSIWLGTDLKMLTGPLPEKNSFVADPLTSTLPKS